MSFRDVERKYFEAALMMAPNLKKKFELETEELIPWIKDEKISEILTCSKKEVFFKDGQYLMKANCTKERYAQSEYLGKIHEVIEIKMRPIPPNAQKKWILEITDLQRTTKKCFRAKQKRK